MADYNFGKDGMFVNGVPVIGAPLLDSSGTIYFCDGNSGNDSNNGKSWSKAKKTLASVFAASHADIARGADRWARRNTIFIAGDSFEEDLVILPQKTDVIGVGSHNSFKGAMVTGNHVPVNTTMGTRFINVNFMGDASGGDIFTLATSNGGTEFWGCRFNATSTAAATGAIIATAVSFLRIEDCIFEGAFSDAAIEFGTGAGRATIIRNNIISGANMGIDVGAGFTSTPENSYIIGNVFKTTLACINDASSKFNVIGNRGITLAAKGASLAGAVVAAAALSLDNTFGTSDANNVIWPANGSI